jgi:hypothetical protein
VRPFAQVGQKADADAFQPLFSDFHHQPLSVDVLTASMNRPHGVPDDPLAL